MVHLKKSAILDALDLQRRRSFGVWIALVAVTTRDKCTQHRTESEDSG
jgi:predicted nucleic acid-binding protein